MKIINLNISSKYREKNLRERAFKIRSNLIYHVVSYQLIKKLTKLTLRVYQNVTVKS